MILKVDSQPQYESKSQLALGVRLALAFSILSLILANCRVRAGATLPEDNPMGTGDGGGQAGEVESIPNLISDIRAEKIDLSQSEMDAFNTKLQNPETQVVKYVAQGDGYIVTEIDPEVRHDAVCLEQERWGVEGSDVVDLCSTLIEGQELILTNNDRDELVALMPFTVASGIEGYAGLAQDGKTIVPILARGSDDQIYVYNQDTLQYHPLGGETQILDILNIDELFLKNGGGTVVDSRSRGVGHVTRLRFKNGIEAIQTPDGSFVSPEFIALQDRIAAAGESFTLLPNGTIEQMTEGGAVIVPGIAVDKNGVMTLSVGGEFVTLDPAKVAFDDTNGVTIDGYTFNENGEWRVEVIKEYPICTPENFRDCEIPVEELFDGTYFRWLEEQAKTLACSPNMRTDVKMVEWARGVIIPDPDTAPNFTKPGSEFFIRDHTAGFTRFILPDEQEVHYVVMPLFMCDLSDQAKIYPIITVASAYYPTWKQQKSNQVFMADLVPRWRKDMNITAIVAGDALQDPGREGIKDPLVARTFAENPDMSGRFVDFVNGEFSALSKPGIVVLNQIASNRAHKYE